MVASFVSAGAGFYVIYPGVLARYLLHISPCCSFAFAMMKARTMSMVAVSTSEMKKRLHRMQNVASGSLVWSATPTWGRTPHSQNEELANHLLVPVRIH